MAPPMPCLACARLSSIRTGWPSRICLWPGASGCRMTLVFSTLFSSRLRAQLRKRQFGDAIDALTLLVKDGVRSDEVVTALGLAALRIEPQHAPDENTPGRDVVARVGRAQLLTILKDFSQARQIFLLLSTEYPTYPELHFAFRRFLLDASETDQAIAEFGKELQQNPHHVSALLEI